MKKRLATFSKANIGTQTKKPTQKQKFNISPPLFAFASRFNRFLRCVY